MVNDCVNIIKFYNFLLLTLSSIIVAKIINNVIEISTIIVFIEMPKFKYDITNKADVANSINGYLIDIFA